MLLSHKKFMRLITLLNEDIQWQNSMSVEKKNPIVYFTILSIKYNSIIIFFFKFGLPMYSPSTKGLGNFWKQIVKSIFASSHFARISIFQFWRLTFLIFVDFLCGPAILPNSCVTFQPQLMHVSFKINAK